MGAALAAIATQSTVAAKAALTKTMLQLNDKRISLMNYLGCSISNAIRITILAANGALYSRNLCGE